MDKQAVVDISGSGKMAHPAVEALRLLLDPGVNAPYEAGKWYVLVERWYLTVAILYLELVFKASTTGGFFPSVVAIALFSVAFGQVFYLLASLAASRKANAYAKAVVLGLLGLAFSVEFFVYRQFSVMYSAKTVLAGAGGVAGGFLGTVAKLVFSLQGVAHIALFFLPLALYLVQMRVPVDRARRATWPFRARVLALVLAVHLVALAIVSLPTSFGLPYAKQYNFQAAAQNYGLLTAVRKDLTMPASTAGFNAEGGPASSEAVQVSTDPEVMDIDFEAAKASAVNEVHLELDEYVSSLSPTHKNEMTGLFEGYNLIFLSAEAFSDAVIDPELTPALFRMATNGIRFTDYYQFDSEGTTGGEFQNIFGMVAFGDGQSCERIIYNNNYFTMGNALNRLGYNGWAFHNNDYTFYNRVQTHNNLGYNNGFMGYGSGMEEYVADQWPQSDLEMVKGTFDGIYWDQEPFNVYYMTVSGHSTYAYNDNMMTQKNWDAVEDLPASDPVRAYTAANLELEYAMEYLIGQLEEKGMADRTVIVLTADHFPYGLNDSATLGGEYVEELYGHEVNTVFEQDKNGLLIWSGALEGEDAEPIVVREPVCSMDILPTLLNLFNLEWDSRLLPGRDAFARDGEALAFSPAYAWKTSLGQYEAGVFTLSEGAKIDDVDAYVERMNAVVANKINYCHKVVESDYFAHLFGMPEDVNAVHDRGVQLREQSGYGNSSGQEATGGPDEDEAAAGL